MAGEIAAAGAGMQAQQRGSTTRDLSSAFAAFLGGMRQRDRERESQALEQAKVEAQRVAAQAQLMHGEAALGRLEHDIAEAAYQREYIDPVQTERTIAETRRIELESEVLGDEHEWYRQAVPGMMQSMRALGASEEEIAGYTSSPKLMFMRLQDMERTREASLRVLGEASDSMFATISAARAAETDAIGRSDAATMFLQELVDRHIGSGALESGIRDETNRVKVDLNEYPYLSAMVDEQGFIGLADLAKHDPDLARKLLERYHPAYIQGTAALEKALEDEAAARAAGDKAREIITLSANAALRQLGQDIETGLPVFERGEDGQPVYPGRPGPMPLPDETRDSFLSVYQNDPVQAMSMWDSMAATYPDFEAIMGAQRIDRQKVAERAYAERERIQAEADSIQDRVPALDTTGLGTVQLESITDPSALIEFIRRAGDDTQNMTLMPRAYSEANRLGSLGLTPQDVEKRLTREQRRSASWLSVKARWPVRIAPLDARR